MTRIIGRRAAASALALLALAGTACGDDDDKTTTEPAPSISQPADTTPGVLSVAATDNAFAPATLTAQAGSIVTIEVKNTGKAPHTFTVTAVNVDKTIEAGKTIQVSFTMPGAGSLPFVCRFHESQGMKGTINTT